MIMLKWVRTVVGLLLLLGAPSRRSSSHQVSAALAFSKFPSLPKLWTPPQLGWGGASLRIDPIESQKAALLQALAGTNSGKTATVPQQREILRMVRQLEVSRPAPDNLLVNGNTATRYLNGTWYLQYTSPSQISEDGNKKNDNNDDNDPFVLVKEDQPSSLLDPDQVQWKPQFATEGAANIPIAPFQARGSVSAAGVTVDTSNKIVEQIIDVLNSRVENVVYLDDTRLVRAAGTFRPSQRVPTRAVVSFDTLELQWRLWGSNKSDDNNNNNNKPGPQLTLSLGWIFNVIGALRQSRENGWLETTYVDDDLRIGRGNKGTLFVLTRNPHAVPP